MLETDAVVQVLDKHEADLRRYAGKFFQERADVDEVLQEMCARILAHQKRAESAVAISRAYLFVVLANLIKDRLRLQRTRYMDKHVPIEEAVLESTSQPELMVLSDKLREHLVEGLKRLPVDIRQVFVFHRFSQLSYPEIAEKLGVSTRTVERRMSQAMAGLRRQLRDYL